MSVYTCDREGDRLRVSVAGVAVGWVDLATGERHPKAPGVARHLEAALEDWCAEQGAAVPVAVGAAAGSAPAPDPFAGLMVTAEEFLAGSPGTPAPARSRGRRRAAAPAAGGVGEDLAARRPGVELEREAARRRPHPVLYVLARIFGRRTDDWAWRVGAAGERAVGRKLDRLTGHGYRVLHSIPLGRGGDVDHLVIGPRGVVVVNTKHHRGAYVTVGERVVFVGRKRGRVTNYVEKARREADRVRQAVAAANLGEHVPVRAVLVVHGAMRVHRWRRNEPLGVTVLPSGRAGRWLRSGRAGAELLSPEQVDALYERLRWSAAWRRV
jgi:nuclease-like protein